MQTIQGVVGRGERRGTQLGFPTANMPISDDSLSGVYAARVTIKDDEAPYMAAVYADKKRGLLEAHLLDFNDDLYGMDIEVKLFEKIRDDASFADEAALKGQIAEDIAKVRAYFHTA